MNKIKKYETCLPDTEVILPELAKIIGAEYQVGTFSKAEDDFCDSGKDTEEWILTGKSGVNFSVLFEKYEGYLFVSISGTGDVFNEAKSFLYNQYLAQGGNPNVQKKP